MMLIWLRLNPLVKDTLPAYLALAPGAEFPYFIGEHEHITKFPNQIPMIIPLVLLVILILYYRMEAKREFR
jgi:hypothetical protein